MNFLALIPARSGSKGIPGKNIRLLGGKPLLAYSIESALNCPLLDNVIVSTDSEEIAQIATQYGAEVPFIRPAELATDSAKTVDVVVDALKTLMKAGKSYDAVVLLQPTNPFRPDGFIEQAIQHFIAGNFDALVSVLPVPTEYNPHWVFEPDKKGILHIATGEKEIIPRRQDLPPAYFRDGSVYITRTSILLHHHSLYGQRLGFIEADPAYYVNIDTPEDWLEAEVKLKHLYVRH